MWILILAALIATMRSHWWPKLLCTITELSLGGPQPFTSPPVPWICTIFPTMPKPVSLKWDLGHTRGFRYTQAQSLISPVYPSGGAEYNHHTICNHYVSITAWLIFLCMPFLYLLHYSYLCFCRKLIRGPTAIVIQFDFRLICDTCVKMRIPTLSLLELIFQSSTCPLNGTYSRCLLLGSKIFWYLKSTTI